MFPVTICSMYVQVKEFNVQKFNFINRSQNISSR